MTSLRNRLVPAVAAAFAIGAIAVSGCGSSNKTSSDTGSTTTTTVESTSTTTVAATTTAAGATTPPTTAKPVTATTAKPVTQPTNPPEIITSFSVSDAAACAAVDVTFQGPPPAVTISWTVVGADSVNLLIDGGLYGGYGLSGSESLPAACNSGHNVHTYEVVAIKGGQKIASKKATRGT